MKSAKFISTSFVQLIGCVALACCAVALAQAEEKTDPSGTWTWTQAAGRNGGAARTNTLTLKVSGETLTGTLATPGRGGSMNTVEITNGKYSGGEISFTISSERNGATTTTTYSGKITADGIVGTVKVQRGDNEPRSRKWTATRPAVAPASTSGS